MFSYNFAEATLGDRDFSCAVSSIFLAHTEASRHPRKKRPCGIEPEYVLNHILFNIQHIILKLGTLFYHTKAFLNTAEIK